MKTAVFSISSSLLSLFICILVSGCAQTRYSVIPQMPDAGNVHVATQHRWKLVDISDPISVKHMRAGDFEEYESGYLYGITVGEIRRCMQREYPDVFAEDGIPFKIRLHDAVGESDISAGAYLVTLGIWPGIKTNDRRTTFALEFDGCDVRSAFGIRTLHEEAISCWTPLPLCFYDTPYHAGVMRNFGYYDKAYFFMTCYESDMARLRCQAIAYAIAMKLKGIEADNAKIAAVLKANQKESAYRIVKCERDAGSEVAYSFTVELSESAQGSLLLPKHIRSELCASLKANHLVAFPKLNPNSVFVDIGECEQIGGKIVGKAVIVMQVTPLSLSYNADTRRGALSVRFHATQHQQAREWIRTNIAILARDKNIALVTGKVPPDAKFYLEKEELKNGNELEIGFKTE